MTFWSGAAQWFGIWLNAIAPKPRLSGLSICDNGLTQNISFTNEMVQL